MVEREYSGRLSEEERERYAEVLSDVGVSREDVGFIVNKIDVDFRRKCSEACEEVYLLGKRRGRTGNPQSTLQEIR